RAPSAAAAATTHPTSPMDRFTCSWERSMRSHTVGGTHGSVLSRRGRARLDQCAMVASSSASWIAQATNSPQVAAAGTLDSPTGLSVIDALPSHRGSVSVSGPRTNGTGTPLRLHRSSAVGVRGEFYRGL